jgi:hypothetical protein
MTKKIVIPYFPRFFHYLSPVIFLAAIYVAVKGLFLWAIVIAVTGAVILTTKYVTEIDMESRRYLDYLFFAGLKLSKESQRFERLEKIVVTKAHFSKTLNSRVQTTQLEITDYTATLIFDHGKTLDLITKNDKRELLKGLKDFAPFLNVNVEDRSTKNHYWVDLSRV